MKKTMKKLIATILTAAMAVSVGMPAFANYNKNTDNLGEEIITINKQVDTDLYEEVNNTKRFSKDTAILNATLDKNNGLYKVSSEENLYLQPLGDGIYLPMEKNLVRSINDLDYVNENYILTKTEVEDITSLLQENENINLTVYAPRSSESTGTYDGKKYRFVKVQATDNQTGFQIGKGANIESLAANTVMYAISTLGKSANIGITITSAVLGLLNVDYQIKSDSTCIATKNENVTFQYLDFFEVGSAYVTRGLTSVGTITITTKTTCWVKQSNGDYVNKPINGQPVSGAFGKSETGNSLAAKCISYFEDYSGIGEAMYQDYTTKFRIDFFNSIPAISPKR